MNARGMASSGAVLLVCLAMLALRQTMARACADGDEPDQAQQHAVQAFHLTAPIVQAGAPPDDNLGYKWKSVAPAGYNLQLFAAKNTRYLFNTTPMIPIKLETDWQTMDPVEVNFMPATNPDPASPDFTDRFLMTMKVVNKTGKVWKGFRITIRDDDNTALQDQRKA